MASAAYIAIKRFFARNSVFDIPFGALCIALVSLVFYRYNLQAKSLWYDEAATYQYARLDWATLWNAMHRSDAFYGVYYSFMHCWIGIFGTTEVAMRVPSIFFAALALLPAFLIARRLCNTATAYVTMVLLAVNPFYYHLAREARVYPIAFYAALCLTLIFFHAMQRNTTRLWCLYAVSAVIAMHLHLYALFLICAHGVYLFCFAEKQIRNPFLLAAGAAFFCTLPLAHLVLGDENSQNTWIPQHSLHEARNMPYAFTGSSLLNRIEVPLAVLSLGCLWWNFRGNRNVCARNNVALLSCWLGVPIVMVLILSLVKPLFVPKYLLYVLFPFVLLYSSILCEAHLRRYLAPLGVVIFALNFMVVMQDNHEEMQSWRAGSALLERVASPGDAVMLWPTRGYAGLDYYAPLLTRTQRVKIVSPAAFQVWNSESISPAFDVPAVAHRHARMWVVLNEITDLKQTHQLFMSAELARYYHVVKRTDLIRFSIVELART